MANRDMLAEAIAEAKALKETAIANAKAALEEAFEPRLKSMLSAKLQEMEDEELDEVVNEADSEDLDEAKRAEDKETKRTEKMKYGKDLAEGDDEEDLDEILAELDGMDEAEEEEEVEVDAEEEGEGEEMEDEDIDLEEMSEDDLKSFIEDVIRDMVGSGELEAGEEFEVEDDMEMDGEMEDEESVEDEVEVDEIMEGEDEIEERLGTINDPDSREPHGNLEEEKMDEGIMSKLKDMSEETMMKLFGVKSVGELMSAIANASPINKESVMEEDIMEEVNALKAELHEVNLLNAKLLYTNKIFRAKNLSENHKVKVLEAFDKAETVKEVKLVFETLNGELKEKTTIKENLGSASKPLGVAPSKQPIVEVDSQVARWQKLAGIK